MMAGEITTIVIFGGTRDLARRTLLPALFQLGCKGRSPDSFRIVGFGRQESSDNRYPDLNGHSVREFGDLAVCVCEWCALA